MRWQTVQLRTYVTAGDDGGRVVFMAADDIIAALTQTVTWLETEGGVLERHVVVPAVREIVDSMTWWISQAVLAATPGDQP